MTPSSACTTSPRCPAVPVVIAGKVMETAITIITTTTIISSLKTETEVETDVLLLLMEEEGQWWSMERPRERTRLQRRSSMEMEVAALMEALLRRPTPRPPLWRSWWTKSDLRDMITSTAAL